MNVNVVCEFVNVFCVAIVSVLCELLAPFVICEAIVSCGVVFWKF